VTMAVMTDPRSGTAAIIPHAVATAPGSKRRGVRLTPCVPQHPHATRPAPPMIVDVLGATLVDAGRVPGAIPGSALTSELVLYEDGRVDTGIWEVTPGAFDAAHGPYVEFMHFVAGDATITAADGQVHEVRPGAALTVPSGWRGRWDVRETVRKTYVIVRDAR
jgi:uncharacterized cupin superfamily protein